MSRRVVESFSTQLSTLPRHVAIIMDGNGRWARFRHLPRTAGHKQGVNATRKIVESCRRRGIEVLTLFAFSSENWQRPVTEVSVLMELFFSTLRSEATKLAQNQIQVRFLGDMSAFSEKLQRQIQVAETTTAHARGMLLNIAANYGGRWDITQAVRCLIEDVIHGTNRTEKVTSDDIECRLTTAGLRDPDLFIRTGGEQRISNFLLWQLAYTELYFTDSLWPDFDESALDQAFRAYASRQRRFGKTGDQIAPATVHDNPECLRSD
jgi:undecaprenyl diphosphate synthase